MKYWRIKLQDVTRDGEQLYWNNEIGWGDKESALKLSKHHTYMLPLEGIEEAMYCCDNCGKELLPLCRSEITGQEEDYQFNEALWIYFQGGYGMFIDNTGPCEQECSGVLCVKCATELMNHYEWIKDLLSGINIVDAEAAWERHMERLVEET